MGECSINNALSFGPGKSISPITEVSGPASRKLTLKKKILFLSADLEIYGGGPLVRLAD